MLQRLVFLIPLLLLVLSTGPAAAQPSPDVQVTLFHDTHLHGQLEGPDGITFGHYVGLARQQARTSEATASLLVGNGDDIAPSLMSAVFGGQHIVDSFNAAKLDVD